MCDLLNFIGTTKFNKLGNLVASKKLSFKHSDNLYMIFFKDDADFKDPIVRQANGVILEKNTNKIIHYSFEKTYDGLSPEPKKDSFNELELDKKSLQIELFNDGSIIKLYYYCDKWNIGTSRFLDAERSYWGSSKSFKVLFEETIKNTFNTDLSTFFETLDKSYAYTFIIQHPEINSVVNIGEPVAYIISKVNTETLQEVRPERENLNLNISFEDMLENQNYMIYQEPNIRIRILSEAFKDLKNLKGNYPSIGLKYLECINNEEKTSLLMKSFPQNCDIFRTIDALLLETCNIIFYLYKLIHVFKQKGVDVDDRLSRTIYQLHSQYLHTRIRITEEDVYNKVTSLNPRTIAKIINYKY
jgi:hypothetical protein